MTVSRLRLWMKIGKFNFPETSRSDLENGLYKRRTLDFPYVARRGRCRSEKNVFFPLRGKNSNTISVQKFSKIGVFKTHKMTSRSSLSINLWGSLHRKNHFKKGDLAEFAV